jgi:drug/metabolite transporter (DMT)-like permease
MRGVEAADHASPDDADPLDRHDENLTRYGRTVLAVGLSLLSAVLFGAMSLAVRYSIARNSDTEAGAAGMLAVATAVCGLVTIAGNDWRGNVLPFVATGVLAPGLSQIFFVRAVKAAGPSRASVVMGTAPLTAVAIALVFLGEPLRWPLIVGALAIVCGGLALAREPARPDSFRLVGIALAIATTVFFATRDNIVRWLAGDTQVPPQLAAATSMLAGTAVVLAYLILSRGRRGPVAAVRAARAWMWPGLLFGASYASLFEAYYRGRVSVVSPLTATESLFAVLFAAILLRRSELVGRHLVAGALLIVAGGALIGAFR